MPAETFSSSIGRTSWAYVFGDGDPRETKAAKFKLTLMLPKNVDALESLGLNPAQKAAMLQATEDFMTLLREEAKELAKSKFRSNWEGVRWDPFINGDDKAEKFEGNKNFWLLRMKSKFKVKVGCPKKSEGYIVDGNTDIHDGFYSGCWARVVTSLYTYDVDGNKGVAVGLGFVQKAYNDDAFSTGGKEFSDDIVDLDVDESDFPTNDASDDGLDDL
jgi:hypothetical protein